MRDLNLNKRKIYYALYLGEERVIDENGFETGETRATYSDPVELRANVSANVGADGMQAFGNFMNYTRTITVADTKCEIAENSVIWFDVEPDGPYNYIVTRKADSINGVLYAIQEVVVK